MIENKTIYYSDPKPILYINKVHVTACTKNEIVQHLIFSNEYKELVKTICKSNMWEELLSEITLYILEKWDLSKMQNLLLKGEFKFYFVKSVKWQWEGKASSFFLKYRKHYYATKQFDHDKYHEIDDTSKDNLLFEVKNQIMLDTIQSEIEKLDWYENKIWNMKQSMSVRKISWETGINEDSLFKTLYEIKKKIQDEANKKLDYL